MFVLLFVPSLASAATTVVSGNTSVGENQPGWMFNRDTANQAPFLFNLDQASAGIGSLFVPAITNTVIGNGDKFIAENFILKPIADVRSISYDFMINQSRTTADAGQFYMSVYANFATSSPTKFYDCRYDVVPTIGSTSGFTTVTFDPTQTYPVTQRGSSPHICPTSPAAMDSFDEGSSTIRVFAINVGDTSPNDTGISGYLDNVVVVTNTGTDTYDFDPDQSTLVSNNEGEYYMTIQGAIDGTSAEGIINIPAGTYTEVGQIVINKNLSIVGADKNTTIIKPAQDITGSSADTPAWILVNASTTFNLSNVTLDGNSPTRRINWAIASYGEGTINNNIIKNIKDTAYAGRGVVVFGNMVVSNNTFENIERIGVHVRGAYIGTAVGNAVVTGNTYTGKGTGDFLDYGIEVGAGASATITNNTISNNRGVASADSSDSAGILVTVFYGPGTTATVTGNVLTNNSTGLYVGYASDDSSTVSAHENQFVGNTTAVVSTNPSVDASHNYWATSTPANVILGPVSVSPWYINPGRTTLNTDVVGTEVTVTQPKLDFQETTDGGVTLPEGVSTLTLSNDSVLSFASSTNTKTGTDIVVGGATTSLTTFTIEGATSTVDLSVAQIVGGKSVTIEQAVTLSSGSSTQPIILTNSSVSNISVSIPDTTTILAPSGWDGTIAPPQTIASSGTAPSGFSVGSTVISVGSPNSVLIFDKPVTITLEGVTGAVGYKSAGSDQWMTINTTCTGTYDNPTGAIFPGECKISNGTDTKILTYHFTTFGSLSAIPAPVSSGGSYFVVSGTPASNTALVATLNTPNTTGEVLGKTISAEASKGKGNGEVKGVSTYAFGRNMRFGARGVDVEELQKMLIAAGHLKLTATTQYFGPLTKAAVIKWQAANKLPATGFFGPMSRALTLK